MSGFEKSISTINHRLFFREKLSINVLHIYVELNYMHLIDLVIFYTKHSFLVKLVDVLDIAKTATNMFLGNFFLDVIYF